MAAAAKKETHAPGLRSRSSSGEVGKVTSSAKASSATGHKFFEGVGRRKTATARVRVFRGEAKLHGAEPRTIPQSGTGAWVNGKPVAEYFRMSRLAALALQPVADMKPSEKLSITAKVFGGGIHAQAEAVRHGLARALAKADPDLKSKLRIAGFLTRDSRMVERKKFGYRKARRAPQWQKR